MNFNNNLRDELEGYISKVVELYNVPGVSVAVSQNEEVVFSKMLGYADVQNKKEIEESTLFPIGSLTKSFTAAAIGILVDEGKLDLDTPISEYIQEFELYDRNATEKVTMRDVLSHRTGLSKHIYWWYNSRLSREELVSKIKCLEPVKECCSEWEYTNVMYVFAGYLIEKIEGSTWEAFVSERILKPLKMYDTFATPDEIGCMHRLSTGYGEIDGQITEIELPELSSVAPAGSIVSTVEDIVKWAASNMNAGEMADRILSLEYLEEMQSKQVDASFSVCLKERTAMWHMETSSLNRLKER